MAYFRSNLSPGDYFVTERSERGHFFGKIADRLNLDLVNSANFEAFAENDMIKLGSDKDRQRMSELKYHEFTYSAPKAVSVAAVLDDRVSGELYEAVKDELRWFETKASVRDQRGKLAFQEVTRPTGNMIAALFRHETSRTNDPDFHVHGLIGNVSWDEERQEWFALHYGTMMEMRKTLDARIHNNLAARMTKLGYTVQAAPQGFGLAEVSRPTEALFSERATQVKLAEGLLKAGYSPEQLVRLVKPLGEAGKRAILSRSEDHLKMLMGAPDNRNRLTAIELHEHAVNITRPAKVNITSAGLRENVIQRLAVAGEAVSVPNPQTPRRELASPALSLEEAIKQGAEAVFERESVVRLDVLLGEIVRLAPGQISNEALEQRLRDNQYFVIARKDGHEQVTTNQILAEERTLLQAVASGTDTMKPLHPAHVLPRSLQASDERIAEMVAEAAVKGEELTDEQAATWLQQFGDIHKYVCISTDQYVNIRGGAGVGKTFALELLVSESQKAGRPAILCAPYGEQSRVTMRAEAPRLEAAGKRAVARAFQEANTVDYLLVKARTSEAFLAGLKGADIYVDEAGLLDTPKALQLVRLAQRANARVIFQGDIQQMAAVGRGQPIKLMQEQLGLGMHVARASLSRRQKSNLDKQLAADLSSGDDAKFESAVARMAQRGMIEETRPQDAIERVAQEIVEGRVKGKEVVAVSSVHRIAEELADRVHQLHLEKTGRKAVSMDVHVKRALQKAELGSSQFYNAGDCIEFKHKAELVRHEIISVTDKVAKVHIRGKELEVPLKSVKAIYQRKTMDRSVGERVILQEKIKQEGRVFEKGSRQTIKAISRDGLVRFESGLEIQRNDGRIRQGDCLTDYKSQGIKGASVRGIEDNGSAMAMANKEAFHVKGTRHVDDLKIFVESTALFTENIMRTNAKMSALELAELVKSRARPALTLPPPLPGIEHKRDLMDKARAWGQEFRQKIISPESRQKAAANAQRIWGDIVRNVRQQWRESLPVVSRDHTRTQKITQTVDTRPPPAPGSPQELVLKMIAKIDERARRYPTPSRDRDHDPGFSR